MAGQERDERFGKERERDEIRRDLSRNQNNEMTPILEPGRDDKGEREREAGEPKNKREKKAPVEEERESILIKRLIIFFL